MGPIVTAAMTTLILRPFTSSTTYKNLKANGVGVFHVTDDVLLIAAAAIGKLQPPPDAKPNAKPDAKPDANSDAELDADSGTATRPADPILTDPKSAHLITDTIT